MQVKEHRWPEQHLQEEGWENPSRFVTVIVSVAIVSLAGTRILGYAHNRAEAEHALDGIPLVAAAFGAALVAAALIVRRWDSVFERRMANAANTYREQAAGRPADEELARLEQDVLRYKAQGMVEESEQTQRQLVALVADQQAAEEQAAAEARRRDKHRLIWAGISNGLETPGAVLLLLAAVVTLAGWMST